MSARPRSQISTEGRKSRRFKCLGWNDCPKYSPWPHFDSRKSWCHWRSSMRIHVRRPRSERPGKYDFQQRWHTRHARARGEVGTSSVRTLIPATPLQDFDANSRSPVGNETEPLRCGTRDVDDDTAFANRRRGTAIDDAQIDG